MPTRLRTIITILTITFFISGCSNAVDLKWEYPTEYTSSRVVAADDGTHIISTYQGLRARTADGTDLGTVELPRTGLYRAYSNGPGFLLFGVQNNSLWRIELDNSLLVISDETLYAGTELSNFRTQQLGGEITLTWSDQDQFYYWLDEYTLLGELNEEYTLAPYTISNHYQFYSFDSINSQLNQVDLITGTLVDQQPLPSEMLNVSKILVNDHYVVGSQYHDNSETLELLIFDKTSGTVTHRGSSGGFGTFELKLTGQDGDGNIYYHYLASLAHAGFSIGTHIRAISLSEIDQWDYKLAASAFEGNPDIQIQPSGIKLAFQHNTITSVGANFIRKTTSRYVHLNAQGVVQKSFFLKAPQVETSPIIGIHNVISSGYLVKNFASDSAGNVYLYGKFISPEQPDYTFAGMY